MPARSEGPERGGGSVPSQTRSPPLNLLPGSVQPWFCSYPETMAVAPAAAIRVVHGSLDTKIRQGNKTVTLSFNTNLISILEGSGHFRGKVI